MPSDTDARQRRFRAGLVLRAIETNAPLLAARLHRYAAGDGLDWTTLAHTLNCSEDDLNRIACCRPPRPERFVEDAEAIARLGGVDPTRLLLFLRRLQVLEVFARNDDEASYPTVPAEGNTMLLAARDRDEEASDADEEADDA